VLVLEDEWIIAEQIETALAESGFAVVGPVGRVDAAIALLETESVDAVLLDINMHGEPTFQFAARLVQKSIPFIFVSGYSTMTLPTAFASSPLLQKPIDPVILARRLRALLAPAG
jgi:DNA-binding response OmpR family regulator